MSERIWHKGPPPHVGWWNASINREPNRWRWWDGKKWSVSVTSRYKVKSAAYWAGVQSIFDGDVEWTDYWPENARVARVDPRAQSTDLDILTVELMAAELISQADKRDLNVTIERIPLRPLAMRHNQNMISVWPKRS